jgi:hypothetical protein
LSKVTEIKKAGESHQRVDQVTQSRVGHSLKTLATKSKQISKLTLPIFFQAWASYHLKIFKITLITTLLRSKPRMKLLHSKTIFLCCSLPFSQSTSLSLVRYRTSNHLTTVYVKKQSHFMSKSQIKTRIPSLIHNRRQFLLFKVKIILEISWEL